MIQIFKNRGDKVPDDTKQALEVTVKRTAKNSMRTYAKDIKRETLMEKEEKDERKE